ncbi:MAG: CopD family protein [Sphingobacteriaceae bacterium]|nr:CopD family protein [Sphingobacteriaceae bacterium]
MDYVYVKAIHIIFIVTWFAALFYIVRLFIYNAEAQLKNEIEKTVLTQQFLIMQKRLWYIIGWPGMIGSLIFGWWMIFLNPALLTLPWMWLKLIAVTLLVVYHLQCQRILSQQKQGIFKLSSTKLRLFNELATILLVAIVFLVVVKSTSGLIWGVLGLIIFGGILFVVIKLYKKKLEQKEQTEINKSN